MHDALLHPRMMHTVTACDKCSDCIFIRTSLMEVRAA